MHSAEAPDRWTAQFKYSVAANAGASAMFALQILPRVHGVVPAVFGLLFATGAAIMVTSLWYAHRHAAAARAGPASKLESALLLPLKAVTLALAGIAFFQLVTFMSVHHRS